ncbi:MAG: peptidoglycan-binding protein [bacterium]|nr:peptidoglycan-binding protein [bacterium]
MKKYAILWLLAVVLLTPDALAQTPTTAPYTRTFIVTAYYSPLPEQSFYMKGNLEADTRLNGNGVMGADLTPVYDGMIAAPRNYAFGTQVDCGSYFVGTVHDRGGAIVNAGVRTNAYDRLDVWTGHGEQGLLTALSWGRRTLTCTVYPPGHGPLQQFVNLPQSNLAGLAKKLIAKTKTIFNQTVTSYTVPPQYLERFTQLGYEDSKQAIIAFQLRHQIIPSPEVEVAGLFGPGTKAKVEEIFSGILPKLPPEGLEKGMVSAEVRKLQQILFENGYLKSKPTATFGPQTKQALIRYQIDKNLISSTDHPAAGYIGPETRNSLRGELLKPHRISVEEKQTLALEKAKSEDPKRVEQALAAAEKLDSSITLVSLGKEESLQTALEELSREWVNDHESYGESEYLLASAASEDPIAKIRDRLKARIERFQNDIGYGEHHADLPAIQELLKSKGYFTGPITTDLFGEQTHRAITKLQRALKIASPGQVGYGYIGPGTRLALNKLYNEGLAPSAHVVSNRIKGWAIHPQDLKLPEKPPTET